MTTTCLGCAQEFESNRVGARYCQASICRSIKARKRGQARRKRLQGIPGPLTLDQRRRNSLERLYETLQIILEELEVLRRAEMPSGSERDGELSPAVSSTAQGAPEDAHLATLDPQERPRRLVRLWRTITRRS